LTKVGEEEKEEKEEKEKEKLGDSMPRHFQRKWPRQKGDINPPQNLETPQGHC
jgi:hypothetical protein